jgi:hypothetical protein
MPYVTLQDIAQLLDRLAGEVASVKDQVKSVREGMVEVKEAAYALDRRLDAILRSDAYAQPNNLLTPALSDRDPGEPSVPCNVSSVTG